MTLLPEDLGWQLQWDNPDLRGWSVVAAYVIAAGFCARTALASRKMEPEERRESAVWLLSALGLLFLGINKQLNLQTLFIALGRRAALAGGWQQERRLAQLVFIVLLTFVSLALLWFLRLRCRQVFDGNRWALAGLVVLLVFVLFRAATFNHFFQWAGIHETNPEDDKKWTWALEMGGSACLAIAAVKAKRERGRGGAA
jgi:hypothetical protein